MPIAKITKGKSPAGCLRYVLGKNKAQLLTTNCMTTDANSIAAEFKMAEVVKELRQEKRGRKTYNKVHHVSIAVPIDIDVDEPAWKQITEDYLAGMGFDPTQNQYVAALHHDTDHQHLHLIVNRIRLDGTTTPAWKDWEKAEGVMRKLEADYGLPSVTSSQKSDIKAPTVGEVRRSKATGQPILRQVIQSAVEQAAKSVKSIPELARSLSARGIKLTIKPIQKQKSKPKGKTAAGKAEFTAIAEAEPTAVGLLFSAQNEDGTTITFSASSLGRRYTASGLQRNFGLSLEEPTEELALKKGTAEENSLEHLTKKLALERVESETADVESDDSDASSDEFALKLGEPQLPTSQSPRVLPVIPPEAAREAIDEEAENAVRDRKSDRDSDCTEKETEQEEQKRFYQKLWKQLQKEVMAAGIPNEQAPLAVAIVALKRHYGTEQAGKIVAQSPQIQKIVQQRGKAKAVNAIEKTVKTAEKIKQREDLYRKGEER